MRGRRYGLRSRPLREAPFEIELGGGETARLVHSAFNPDWLGELGIVPEVIVDLGSFDGGDAARFKRAFPQARIITVEADPDRFAGMRARLAGQDIEPLNFAACASDEEIDWFAATIAGETHAQGSIYRHTDAYKKKFPFVEQAAPVKVPGRRFDSFAREAGLTRIDLLHMDIEGAEHTVLETLGDLRPRLIYMEWREGFFQGRAAGRQTEALLASTGYRLILQQKADRLYFRPR